MKGHHVATPEDPEKLARRRAGQRKWDEKNRRARGVKPFREAECGTRSGYNKHLKKGTPICTPCREANTEYRRNKRADQRNS